VPFTRKIATSDLFTAGMFCLVLLALTTRLFPSTARLTLDVYIHDTFFPVSGFALALALAAFFALFAVIYRGLAAVFHTPIAHSLGLLHFILTTLATAALLASLYFGSRAIPHRGRATLIYFLWSMMIGTTLFVFGQLVFLLNLAWSTLRSQHVSGNLG
jgi:cytochrome c oxidase subunit I